MTSALLVVDVQNDFCEGGSLAVEGGNEVSRRIASELLTDRHHDVVVATRDWHVEPGEHFSAEPDYRDSWPHHCVAGTRGAAFNPAIDPEAFDAVFSKGQTSAAYSGFEGRANVDGRDVDLDHYLRERGVDTITIVGLATDYCVAATATDAAAAGWPTLVDTRYCAGVAEDTTAAAIDQLEALGVRVTESPE